jgi:hypothetical protein
MNREILELARGPGEIVDGGDDNGELPMNYEFDAATDSEGPLDPDSFAEALLYLGYDVTTERCRKWLASQGELECSGLNLDAMRAAVTPDMPATAELIQATEEIDPRLFTVQNILDEIRGKKIFQPLADRINECQPELDFGISIVG